MQENPLNECRKQFFEVQKKKKQMKEFAFRTKSFEIIPSKIENSFDKPTRIFSPKVRYVFLTVWKELKILKILWKRKVFLQKWPLDTKKTVLTTMSIKFEKIPNFFHQSPLVSVNFLEQNDNVMPEDRLSECRKQFSKSGGTLSYGSPQRFSSKLEKIVKVNIFFRNQTFLEKSFVQVECTFDNFSKVFSALLQIVLPTVGKQRRNSKNSYKKQFNQNSLSDTKTAVFTNLPKVHTEHQKPSL